LALTFQESAEPWGERPNLLTMPSPPSILRLVNLATLKNSILESRDKISTLAPDVALSLENPALAKVKPINNQDAQHGTERTPADRWRDCLQSIYDDFAHGLVPAICGALGASLVWLHFWFKRMTPNEKS
jgi:hypothetical protein